MTHPDYIISKVANYLGVTPEQIKSDSRLGECRFARAVSEVIVWLNGYSLRLAAESIYIGRNHSSVLHSLRTLQNDYNHYPEVRKITDELCQKLVDENHRGLGSIVEIRRSAPPTVAIIAATVGRKSVQRILQENRSAESAQGKVGLPLQR